MSREHGALEECTDGLCVLVDPAEGWEDWEIRTHVRREIGLTVDTSAPLKSVSWLPDGWLRYGVK